MNKKIISLGLVALVIAACGGGGAGTVITNSPFAGQWSGTWTSPPLSQNGTANVTFGTNGAGTGTTHNNQSNADGTFTGIVDNSGQFSGSSQYPGQNAFGITGTMTLSNGGNTLTGNFIQNINGTNYAATFSLTKQ